MALQYIDKEGLARFWKNTKEYVDEADKLLQEQIDSIIDGTSAVDELRDKLNQEITDRQEADTTLQSNIEAEATARQEADAALLGTPEDSKETNTIYGLRAQIDSLAAESSESVDSLREEVLGDSSLLSEGKIPTTHTLDAIKKEVGAEETIRASEVTRLEGLITEASTSGVEALNSLRNEIYGSEVETVDADHTLAALKTSKVDVEGGKANNFNVNNITASGVADFRGASTRVKTLTEEEAQTDRNKNQGTAAASIQFVSDVVNSRISQAQALVYKGTIRTKEDLETLENPSVGWMYKVTSDEIDFSNQSYINDNGQGYLAHQGDMIVCQVAGITGNTAKWDIIKHNDEGQVIGPSSSVVDRIAVFTDGTGKAIKVADKTVSDIYTDLQAEIDSDVAAVKNELLGTGATSDDTIKGSKRYTDERISSTKLSFVEVKAEGDSDPVGTFSNNKLSINIPKYRLESKAAAQDINYETRIKANETKLADVVDTTVGTLIDSDVALAKSSLIGTDSDASTADTIFGAKKRADEVRAELQESIDTLNLEAIKTITISEDASDEGPTAITSTNTVALHLPNYRLESEAAAKDIIKGTLLKVSDDVHEDITVENNTVILSLHNYALKEVQAELDDKITALENLTAGSWKAQNDEGVETNTIKEYVDLKAARIPDSEITALMDKING